MDNEFSIEREMQINNTRVKVYMLVMALFIVAPRLLGFVFIMGGIGGFFHALEVWYDKTRPLYGKVAFFTLTPAFWLLAFGFGTQKPLLILIGLMITFVISITDFFFRRKKTIVGIVLDWITVMMIATMFYSVATGRTPIGVDMWH